MKKSILFLFLFVSVALTAQEVTVTGRVISDDNTELPGATIAEKGTANGVVSDFNGNYEITVSSKDAVIEVSYIGHVSQEIKVGDQSEVNFTLAKSAVSVGEVQVTGFAGVVGKSRKRVASIQKTPESVTAFNSDGIEKIGINNITTFANLVPNLKLSESQAIGVNSLVVRGIPQIRNSDAPVAFVVDGVTIADPSLLNQELFDLALVEVVKGPQGALYGKNAIGGAINIYTKEPTNTRKHTVTAGYGNGNAYVGRLVSSGAIVEDKLFYRFSSQIKNFDGLLTNEFLNEKVDNRREFTTRAQLTYKVSPNFKINATAQYLDFDGGATYYSIAPEAVDNDGWTEYLNPNPTEGNNLIHQDVLGESTMNNFYGNVNVEYNFDNVKLQSITSYSDVDRYTVGDLDFTEVFVLDQGETNDTETFNQEIRLTNRKTDTKFDWSIGGFYQSVERTFFQSDYFLTPDWAVTDYVATFNTLAVFGFFDYEITDKLTAAAGIRFDVDRFNLDDALNAQTDDMSANVPQPKVSLSYQANDDVLVYTNYGRGYRAGGFNPSVTDLFNRDFKGEISDNFELGVKTSWWNKRFILNGSFFYSDFKNRQQNIITLDDFIPGNYNYDRSEIVGVEFDTKIRLSKYLDVLFNYGMVNSTITEASTTGGADGTARDLSEFVGNKTPLIPQNNFNIGLASTIPVNDNATLDVSVNYNGTGTIYWEDSNSPDFTSDPYQLLDAQIGLTMNKFRVTLWGRNILNEQYYLEYVDFGIGWRGTPATVGGTVSVTF